MSSVQNSVPRCTQCNGQKKENTRNLIVSIDGTGNESGPNNTNVVKLHDKIDLKSANPEQLAVYFRGIGTRSKPLHCSDRIKRAVYDTVDKAVALSVKKTVKDAYRWLAEKFQEGDQIYLFGFSRGAYQVRVLAGMIHEVGLLKGTTENEIEKAYGYYKAIRSTEPKTRQSASDFKNSHCWKDLRVHFVGVWDTVSSVGLMKGDVFLSTSSSAAHACHFRHALALDEFRVKFMPEYFHEMNSPLDQGKSKYVVTYRGVKQASPASDTLCDHVTDLSGCDNKQLDVKEVWFAGSHSDVGGQSGPGNFCNAGHVSLLWMRREAAVNGLMLKPTDVVWLPDDLDSGVTNSMTSAWRPVEYLPIKHQVSFSGAGEHAVRLHRQQARRIIPGQKVHASVLYANTYKPKATLGEGFDIPIMQSGLDDVELDDQFWETGLFDDTAAQELLISLGSQDGVLPIHLDRLLFMLRFKEGRHCVRNVPDWKIEFIKLIEKQNCAPLVKLVVIVAYYETSCDHEAHQKTCTSPPTELPQDVFDHAKRSMSAILAAHDHRGRLMVVALLRLLTKHQVLREHILSPDILKTLGNLLDPIIRQPTIYFRHAMDGLICLLQCAATRKITIDKLTADTPSSNESRLSQILKVEDSYLLTAALRMMLTLAQIEKARDMCAKVKPRIRVLATKREGLVGHLAAEILLVLYDLDGQNQLNIHDKRTRANLASALVRLNLERHGPADDEGSRVDPRQQILRLLFGLDAKELSGLQKKLIGELKKAVEKGNARERTVATMTLLKLCETTIVRTQLCEIKLLDVFISQLQRKDDALLGAYALVTCLKYRDMKKSIKDNGDWPKHIIDMLDKDHFDDAVGTVEGFRVFGDFMQDADLREKILKYDIIHVLETKLGKGKAKENRTGLIYLGIIRTCDPDRPWTNELVDIGLKHLKSSKRQTWEAGAMILSALAQTEHGVAAIVPRIYEIVEMILPEEYHLIQATSPQEAAGSSVTPSLPETQTESIGSLSTVSRDVLPSPKPPSCVMGPAYALRILARNETLRNHTRKTIQYDSMKHMYRGSGTFVSKTGKWLLQKWDDVIKILDEVFQAVDQ